MGRPRLRYDPGCRFVGVFTGADEHERRAGEPAPSGVLGFAEVVNEFPVGKGT